MVAHMNPREHSNITFLNALTIHPLSFIFETYLSPLSNKFVHCKVQRQGHRDTQNHQLIYFVWPFGREQHHTALLRMAGNLVLL